MAKKEKEEITLQEKPKETTVEFLSSLAGVLVTGLFIITFVLQAFEIPSSSMEDTLLIGDHVFVNREVFAPATHWLGPLLPYREIRRGDIVVFLSPEERGLFVVKRIIGIPGDRIHLRDAVVYRNGQKLDEPYALHKQDLTITPTEIIFRRCRRRICTESTIKPGNSSFGRTSKATTSLCLQTATLPWATIAM